MENNKLLAYILIGVGSLFLLSRLDMDTGWIWVGLVAAAFLWGYTTRKSYGLLVAGSILAGVAVGILLEESWGWNGAFLVSLGVGFAMIDRIEPKTSRWPLYVGGTVAIFWTCRGPIFRTRHLGLVLVCAHPHRGRSLPARPEQKRGRPGVVYNHPRWLRDRHLHHPRAGDLRHARPATDRDGGRYPSPNYPSPNPYSPNPHSLEPYSLNPHSLSKSSLEPRRHPARGSDAPSGLFRNFSRRFSGRSAGRNRARATRRLGAVRALGSVAARDRQA